MDYIIDYEKYQEFYSVCNHYVSDAETTRSLLFDTISRSTFACYLLRVDYNSFTMHALDKLRYIGTHTIEGITTRYGPCTRTLQEEIIRYNYAEYCQALAQVLHHGRNLNMISTYGSWKYPKAEWTTTTFPPVQPTYKYPPQQPTRSRM